MCPQLCPALSTCQASLAKEEDDARDTYAVRDSEEHYSWFPLVIHLWKWDEYTWNMKNVIL